MQNAFGESARCLDKLRIVERDERLLWCGGIASGDGADLAIGCIKGRHVWRGSGAFPISVEAAPVELFTVILHKSLGCGRCAAVVADLAPQVARCVWIHTWAADSCDQKPAGRERCIAQEFRWQPKAWSACKQAVLRIALQHLWRRSRGLAIGIAHDDQLDQMLDVPAAVHELDG